MCWFQTLYLKNLSPRVTEEDLMSLFLHFQKHNTSPIVFKLLHGRMKGQAFVTFDCTYDTVTGKISAALFTVTLFAIQFVYFVFNFWPVWDRVDLITSYYGVPKSNGFAYQLRFGKVRCCGQDYQPKHILIVPYVTNESEVHNGRDYTECSHLQ